MGGIWGYVTFWYFLIFFGTSFYFLLLLGTIRWYFLVWGVAQSTALMGRLGRRLGGIWGYAAVCAITGQGGIILGRY